MEEKRNIYDLIQNEIGSSAFSDAEKAERIERLERFRNNRLNVMFVGATGSGKSSTINALFDMEKAKVGTGVNPETDSFESYELGNLVVWDTPGLGDSPEKDRKIIKLIGEKLKEKTSDGTALIDMVIVVIDASQKDLGTVYQCINRALIPSIGEGADKRIILALNQCDMAMKGTHWINELNCPDDILRDFLERKADAVMERVKESTGIIFRPVCYCAGYKEADGEQRKPYNLAKLLYSISMSTPKEKRLVFVETINPDQENWQTDDGLEDYKGEFQRDFWESVSDTLGEWADEGFALGSTVLGVPGGIVGGILGGIAGAVSGAIGFLFG